MKSCPSTLLFSGLLIVVAWCCGNTLRAVCGRFNEIAVGRSGREFAEAATAGNGGRVGLLCRNPLEPDSIERHALIEVDWEISPRVATPIGFDELATWTDDVIVVKPTDYSISKRMRRQGYRKCFENDRALLWSSKTIDSPSGDQSAHCTFGLQGLIGCTAVVGILFAGWLSLRSRRRLCRIDLLLGLAVFLTLAAMAVIAEPSAPNGIGTYGGKAKLFLSSGGIPLGFWRNCEFSVLQPSYPPAMTLVAMLAYFLSGFEFTTCWVQLLVPAMISCLYMELASRCNDWRSRAVAIIFAFSPLTINLASGFYAEPLAALAIAMGINLLMDGRSNRGWTLIGLAGLIRHEGLLIAGVIWCVAAVADCCAGRIRTRELMKSSFFALMPGVCWQILTWHMGASIQGFALNGAFSPDQMVIAATEYLKELTIECGFGGGYLISAMLTYAAVWRESGEYARRLGASMAILSIIAFCGALVMGFCTANDPIWIVETHSSRFLWMSGVPMVVAAIAPRFNADCQR